MIKQEERKLFKIGHLTKLLGITSRTIRYYDQFGLLPHVKRSDGNVRLFDEEDLEIIKKIRYMQKEEFLPLDVIKERLFGKQESQTKTDSVIVTDNTAVLSYDNIKDLPIEGLPLVLKFGPEEIQTSDAISPKEFMEKTKNYHLRPVIQPATEDELAQKYLELHEKGFKRIYSIHVSSTLSKTFDNATRAAIKVSDKIEVLPIDSKSTGAGLGLFVQRVATAIKNGESPEKIQVLISKELPLIYALFSLNNLKYLVDKGSIGKGNSLQDKLISDLHNFKPVFTMIGGKGNIDILECCKTNADVQELIYEKLETEIKTRGGYVNSIMILYHYLYGEALEITNKLKEAYPNTKVYLEEDKGFLSMHLGPESLAVAIV